MPDKIKMRLVVEPNTKTIDNWCDFCGEPIPIGEVFLGGKRGGIFGRCDFHINCLTVLSRKARLNALRGITVPINEGE